MEIWKDIKNNILENRYAISNKGRLKDKKTNYIYISKSNKHNHYISLSLKCQNGSRKRFLLHRLVAETFIPNLEQLPIINHIDENKQNNCVDNLEWCTQKHNMMCWMKRRKYNGKQKNV